MSLLESPSFQSLSAPIKTATLPGEAYVLSIVSLPSYYAISASSPDDSIHLFSKSRLDKVQTLTKHEGPITALRSAHNFAGSLTPVLISSGKDGVVHAWDARSPGQPIMTTLQAGRPRALLSCDISANGMTIAAGTELQGDDASVLYWDPRNPAAPLRAHSSTHSDDITAVHFSRTHGSLLLSVSSDGLVSTSNSDEPDEDEAGLHVGNWGCSIAQGGWVHGQSGLTGIWASSDMETFSVWSGELDLVQDADVRQPSVHTGERTWVTDYFIGAHNNSSIPAGADNDLSLFLGSNEGDIALVSRPTFADANAPWVLSQTWLTGHSDVVRSFLWDEENNVLLTGGEDSKLNAWVSPPRASASTVNAKRENDDAMDVDEDEGISHRKRRRS